MPAAQASLRSAFVRRSSHIRAKGGEESMPRSGASTTVAAAQIMEPGGFAPPSRDVLPIASTSVFVLSISLRPSAHDGRQTEASLTEVSFLCGQAALWNQPGFLRG